jgi:hypothetical protein
MGEKQKLFSAEKHALRNSNVKPENHQNWGATCRIAFVSQENPYLELNRIKCYYY